MATNQYCTALSVYNRWEHFSSANVTEANMQVNIADGQSIINGKIAQRYEVPFDTSPYPPLLVQINRDIALYLSTRTVYSGEDENKSDWIETYYEHAIELLDEIADGKTSLIANDGTLITPRGGTNRLKSNTQNYEPTFGFGDPEGEVMDADRISDEADGNFGG